MEQTDLRYLKSLAKQYPTVAAAATEIINLQAILSLPKGTEHFITDIHGEYDQFQHVLKNGSGAIKRKIEDEFGNAISQAELFTKAAPISGVVLTKLDGTAKGGVVIGIKSQLSMPVKWIGVGEAVEDLRPFNAEEFASALFNG